MTEKATATVLTRRQARKLDTFNGLTSAARRIFLKKNYEDVSISEIADAAGVSRATVYLHFANKSEMLSTVLSGELRGQIGIYRNLASLPRLTRSAVRAWLVDYRKAFDSRRAFWELWQSSAGLEFKRADLLAKHREIAVDTLAERFPAFAFKKLSPSQAERKRVEAYLLLFQIEGAVNYFTTVPNSPKVEVGIDILADRIIAFCGEPEKPVKPAAKKKP